MQIPAGSSDFATDPQAPLLVDQIARARGKWAWEVLELTPEQLGLEIVSLQAHGMYLAEIAKKGAIPAIDLGA